MEHLVRQVESHDTANVCALINYNPLNENMLNKCVFYYICFSVQQVSGMGRGQVNETRWATNLIKKCTKPRVYLGYDPSLVMITM